MAKRLLISICLLNSIPIFAKNWENKNFWLTTKSVNISKVEEHKDIVLKRYVVIPYADMEYEDINNSLTDIEILSKFAYMLKWNKRSIFQRISQIVTKQDK